MGSLTKRNQATGFLCLTLLAAAPAAAQERMYKCVDAKGKTYYTQVPPPECIGRDTQELNKSGSLLRKNPAAIQLSPAQEQAREAERKKKLEEEERSKEERRKNLALLNTYSSEKDIDDARARALDEAQAAIEATERSIAGAQKRRQELESEKERDQRDQRQVRRGQAPLRRADQRETPCPEEVGFLLARQLPFQNFVHLRRIRLALSRLHHLTDEGVERLFLPGAVVFDLLRVCGEDLVDDFFDRAGVGDLLKTALFDDLIGATLSVPHREQDHSRCGCV